MSAWLRRRDRGSSTRCGVENVACASGRARARSSTATATSPVAFQPRAVRTLPESDSAPASTPCEPSDKRMSRLRSELDGGPRRRKGSRLPPTRHCTAAAATRAAAHRLATGAAMMATGGREKTATHALADEAQTVASDIRTSSKCHTCSRKTDGTRVTRTGSDQACGLARCRDHKQEESRRREQRQRGERGGAEQRSPRQLERRRTARPAARQLQARIDGVRREQPRPFRQRPGAGRSDAAQQGELRL
mmetsp:Transcript_29944/g.89023  ORF Transcript_29944/g.89023 Transcript_29944/m.89023 type:complete len:249 (-) Transcript_29944:18-764(-)